MEPKYKRIVLKISGEALAGEKSFGLDQGTTKAVCENLKKCADLGVQIGIVVGGGNFWRGRQGLDMERTRADHMGMLATVINALALADELERLGADVRVQTAVEMRAFAEPYIRGKAMSHLKSGKIVIFACGTGNPFFTTDTAAALRAAEINADIVLKATKVNGIYTADPVSHPEAKKLDELQYMDILKDRLGVMDATATSLCMETKIPMLVFSIDHPENIIRAVMGENIGTIVE